MTDTLISLISIFMGIIGANSVPYIFKKYSFGIVGNTIVGVFGSVFFIKMFGRLGFSPQNIMSSGSFSLVLFIVNLLISFLGGVLGVVLGCELQIRLSK